MPDSTLTAAEFHNVAHKHLAHAVFETLADTKIDWVLVAPLLDAAREVCRGDVREGGARLRLHCVRAEGEEWVEAEEAYLALSVADRDEGEEWLSETWWLSDIAKAEGDPEQVRGIVRALERSVERLRIWLAEQEGGGPAEAGPPPPESD